MTIDGLVSVPRCVRVAASPDGSWLCVEVQRPDADGARFVSQLFRVPVAPTSSEGPTLPLVAAGPVTALTRGDVSCSNPEFRRDGALAFLSKRVDPGASSDDAVAQVWLFPPTGGDATPLTDEPLGVTAFQFSGARLVTVVPVLLGVPHDRQAAVAKDIEKNGPSILRYTQMPVRFWDDWRRPAAPHFVVRDADGGGRRDLTPTADREHRGAPWAVAGERLITVRYDRGPDGIDDGALITFDLATGAIEVVRAAAGWCPFAIAGAPSGVAAALAEDRTGSGASTMQLWTVDGGSARRVVLDDPWLHPTEVAVAPWGGLVVVGARRGEVPVVAVDADGRTTVVAAGASHERVVAGPPGVWFGLRSRVTHPPEPFVVGPEPGSARLMHRFSGPEHELVVEHLDTVGADGGHTHSLLVRAPADARAPVLMWVHGGPISAWGDGWHWRWCVAAAVAAGFAVCLPNPRGSTGYGQGWVDGVWGNTWGGACFDDLMAVTDAVERHPAVDGQRVVMMGGSFGGYMVNWVGGRTDRFRALISHAGVFDFRVMFATTDEPAWFRKMLGVHAWHPDLDRYSPHTGVDSWRTPTMILHGQRDVRVGHDQAVMLFDALQQRGVPSELVLFPDENHWILKPRNIRAWYDAWIGFVRAHVR